VTTAAASWNRSVTLSWMGLNKHLHEPSGTRIASADQTEDQAEGPSRRSNNEPLG
jgi:hypothetical protein